MKPAAENNWQFWFMCNRCHKIVGQRKRLPKGGKPEGRLRYYLGMSPSYFHRQARKQGIQLGD
ncbi:MAG: hypothetical protein D6816_16285 [Bacteroidetes bacterium]|nr:MAG: hypothetical protein D6816_16285 [Bacteroidota bacterium]